MRLLESAHMIAEETNGQLALGLFRHRLMASAGKILVNKIKYTEQQLCNLVTLSKNKKDQKSVYKKLYIYILYI